MGSRSLSPEGTSQISRPCLRTEPVTVGLPRRRMAVTRAVRFSPGAAGPGSGRMETVSPCQAPCSARGGMK